MKRLYRSIKRSLRRTFRRSKKKKGRKRTKKKDKPKKNAPKPVLKYKQQKISDFFKRNLRNHIDNMHFRLKTLINMFSKAVSLRKISVFDVLLERNTGRESSRSFHFSKIFQNPTDICPLQKTKKRDKGGSVAKQKDHTWSLYYGFGFK